MLWTLFQYVARNTRRSTADSVASLLLFKATDEFDESRVKRDEKGRFSSNASNSSSNASVIASQARVDKSSTEQQKPSTEPKNAVKQPVYHEPPSYGTGRSDYVTAREAWTAATNLTTRLNEKKQKAHMSKESAEAATKAQQQKHDAKQRRREEKARQNGQEYKKNERLVPLKSYFSIGLDAVREGVSDKVNSGQAIVFRNKNDDCQIIVRFDKPVGTAYNNKRQQEETYAICTVFSRNDGIHYYPISMDKYEYSKAQYEVASDAGQT